MATTEQLQEIEALIIQLLVEEPEFYLVTLRIKPINNIKVHLEGDNGLPIEKCIYFNRKLYKLVEEKSMFPDGDFSLEVSSPGVDEPLKLQRQYTKNVGRLIEVVFKDDSKKLGKLLQVTEENILIEESTGKVKKAVIHQTIIPFDNIKTTIVQIQF